MMAMEGRNKSFFGLWMFPFWMVLLFLSSCSDEEDSGQDNEVVNVCKVVVLMQEDERHRWERTALWAQQNIAEAQRGMNERIELQLIFKNQDDADLDAYLSQVIEDETVSAVIGPTTSARAGQVALKLGTKAPTKPMITPTATNVEYQRRFASTDYVWNMAECDIAELEVIVSNIATAIMYDTSEPVYLLTPDEDDAREESGSYAEWFAFIAEEYGLNVKEVLLYDSVDDVRTYARKLCGSEVSKGHAVLVFNPSGDDAAIAFDDEVGKIKAEMSKGKIFHAPQIYCSDAFVSERIASTVNNLNYEGVDLYAQPESGFGQAYSQRFGEELVNGEAQFYDAICLVAYAATLSSYTGQTLNDAIMSVVDGRNGKANSWLPADMGQNFQALRQGVCPDIDGVSSSWTFDTKTHASVIGTTFRRWHLYDGHFVTTEYFTTEGSNHSTSSKHMWEWTASQIPTFDVIGGSGTVYPALDERWALLVAASSGWSNYRFQADVFAMYQLLKRSGYEDDHIVLVVEDDIAFHTDNPYQGELRVAPAGENVYDTDAIDYRLSELSPEDISRILAGEKSDRLPHVINADADDNVFVFWSSHGMPGFLDFGGMARVDYELIRKSLDVMSYRKVLFAVEACYSGGLGRACVGLPGALFVTAASPYETSHADVWDEAVGVYLSNGFTRGFQEALADTPDIVLRDLYYSLAQHTTGSHVKLYNVSNYGNVYNEKMTEFLGK